MKRSTVQQRTRMLAIYASELEEQAIKKKAAETGTSVSEYLRSYGLRRVLATKPSADLVAVRDYAGKAKSEIIGLIHIAESNNNEELLKIATLIEQHIDKAIAAAFNLSS
jgi:hypothetical protein